MDVMPALTLDVTKMVVLQFVIAVAGINKLFVLLIDNVVQVPVPL